MWISPAHEVDLVPPTRIGEVMIEDRLVRGCGGQPHGQDQRATWQAAEHDGERPCVAPPRVAVHGAQVARLHEVFVTIAVRGAVAIERDNP